MGKESQIEAIDFSPLAQQKLQELVALLSAEGFGPDGPPRDTTFATIEEFGHQTGRQLARAIDEHLTGQHATHFQDHESCPTCGLSGDSADSAKERSMQTRDGTVNLAEPAFHCPTCTRAFFPSANSAED